MKQVNYFESFDGSVFESEIECIEHECSRIMSMLPELFEMLKSIQAICKNTYDCSDCRLRMFPDHKCPLSMYKQILMSISSIIDNIPDDY